MASLYISYHDVTNGALKVVEGGVTRSTGALSYASYVVENGNPGSGMYTGAKTSITLDGSATPHIAYQIDFGTVQAVKHAVRVAPGSGNCATAAGNGWQCDPIHLDSDIGDYIDIDVGPGGVANIAFYTANDTDAYPMLATKTASASPCSQSAQWTCAPIRHTGQDTGQYVSLEIAPGGTKHLAYRNSTMESLEWAENVGSGGNCGPSGNAWQCEWIDTIGAGNLASGVAMVTDSAGYPVIAYQDVESGDHDLKIARPVHTAPWDPNPNCGPFNLFYTWFCETLDAGNLTHSEAVGGLSMAMNVNGEAAVAYREVFDPIMSPLQYRLKVALESGILFTDGFESGNTSRWSATTP